MEDWAAGKIRADNLLVPEERRRFKRFRIREESSFVLTPQAPSIGEIIDIGKGGFCYQYVGENAWPKDMEKCMLFGGHDSCIDEVPILFIHEQIIDDDFHADKRFKIHKRSVQFGTLSQEQEFLLDCFIWINSVAEA